MKMFLLGLKIAMFICVSVLFSPLIQAQQQLTAEERVEAQELGLEVWNGRPAVFKICPDAETDQPQEYALCAAAQCFTIDNVAYCKCEQKLGKSISLPFFYTKNTPPAPGPIAGDVCDLMKVSGKGDFLVSTFSSPEQLKKDYEGPGALAIYTCPGAGNLSAQCDGGLCFKGTAGTSWPFLGAVSEDEVVCSCPIAASAQIGFQFIGPADCDREFFDQYCGVQGDSSGGDSVSTGTRLAIGAVTGSGTILTKLLDGHVPPISRCFFPAATAD
ncbi:MAG: hypothetical protein ABGX71_07550 [Methyloprofundus sp.]